MPADQWMLSVMGFDLKHQSEYCQDEKAPHGYTLSGIVYVDRRVYWI